MYLTVRSLNTEVLEVMFKIEQLVLKLVDFDTFIACCSKSVLDFLAHSIGVGF